MTYERYGEPKWIRVLRALAASFRIGRFFGVELRMYWAAVVIMPLIGWSSWSRADFPAGEAFVMGLISTVALFAIIYSHEMSHIVAGWRYNIRTPLITLSPLGGLAHMSAPAPNPRAGMVISAAGPAVHLIWLAIFWPLSHWVPWGTGRPDGWMADPLAGSILLVRDLNLTLLVFNLLPFYPMDGGSILRAALSTRMHANRASLIAARVGMGGAVALAIAALFIGRLYSGILLAIAITNFFACRREVLRARWGQGPFGEEREAWESDSEAWRSGESPFESSQTMGGKSGSTGKPSRRARRKADRTREKSAADTAELDRLLARVSEVGLAGLSAKERSTLQRLSKRSRTQDAE